MKAKKIRYALFSLCLMLFFSACSMRRLLVNEIASIVETGVAAFEQEDDLDMLEKALPANIKLMETLLENSPDNPILLVLLARLYGSYGFVFLEEKLEEAAFLHDSATTNESGADRREEIERLKESANRNYRKGVDYALRALESRHGAWKEKLNQVAAQDRFFETLTAGDVPALFWYGFNLGSYANLNRQSVKAMTEARLAEKAMQQVVQLDPDYYFGGAHLFLLGYYASRPPALGGNLEKARWHYERLRASAGDDFLLADLYYARFYLPQVQDKKGYGKVLTEILHSSISRQEYRLFNKVAATRAKRYLEAETRLFD